MITAIWILVMIYLAYRYFMNKTSKKENLASDNNVSDILNSDKYKVKGQYD